MELKLLKLEIENFKGIKKFCLNLGGENALVAGRNGTGKTTLADAWFWLLTGSNADQATKFNALELDESSTSINNQDAEVAATLSQGAKKFSIKKIYRQKWVKKRGQAEPELTGHTTDHYWNDVPVSMKEYNFWLEKFAPLATLRALTDVHHFCGRMRPEDRRQILIDLAGKISIDAICKRYPELAELPQLAGDLSFDEFKKVLVARKRAINKELDHLPSRIDELQKSMPDITGMDETKIRERQSEVDAAIAEIKNKIIAVGQGAAETELKNNLSRLESELGLVEMKIKGNNARTLNELDAESKKIRKKIDENNDQMEDFIKKIDGITKQIDENLKMRSELAQTYRKARAESYTPEDVCFACGQELPPDQITIQIDKFNQKKAENIAEIDAKGCRLSQEYEKLMAEKEFSHNFFMGLSAGNEENRKDLDYILNRIEEIETQIQTAIDDQKAELSEQIAQIQADLENPDDQVAKERKTLEASLSDLQAEYYKIQAQIAKIVQASSTVRRIEERQADLKRVSSEFEDVERQLYLIEQYERREAEYLEENVSGFFEITRWKLFEIQVNQGTREICEPMFDGVPYSTDLNTGMKINIGVDCIKTLQRHYDLELPIFIDNAESITNWLIEPENQVIKLAAAANIDELEVING